MTKLHQLLTERERERVRRNYDWDLLDKQFSEFRLQDFSNLFFVLEEFQVKVPEGFCCVMAMQALCTRAQEKNLSYQPI